jgi:ribosomal protein L2
MEATVERIEYDPNRSCYIMLGKIWRCITCLLLSSSKDKSWW